MRLRKGIVGTWLETANTSLVQTQNASCLDHWKPKGVTSAKNNGVAVLILFA